jgi:hypothetical protein
MKNQCSYLMAGYPQSGEVERNIIETEAITLTIAFLP